MGVNEDAAVVISAVADLGTSGYGLARNVPKISAYGQAYNARWYQNVRGYSERALYQAGKLPLLMEMFSSGATVNTGLDVLVGD